ncbi:MAG: hypothetical protein QM820_24360 [Minicystis sp.]
MKKGSRKPRHTHGSPLVWKSVVSCLVLALTGDVVITIRPHVQEITKEHVIQK